MLTRIEIDGFKTFRQFTLDVPPFLVLIGRNAAGKSNLFDAIQFLRLIADRPLAKAVQELRGDLADLFHQYVDGSRAQRMTFAVEVLLKPTVTDAFGETKRIEQSRLRYEVSIERRQSHRAERPYVAEERVRAIRAKDDAWVRRFLDPDWRDRVVQYGSLLDDILGMRPSPDGKLEFVIDEAPYGPPLSLPATEATVTALSVVGTTAQQPVLFALREELRSWGLLHVDPAALRRPNLFEEPELLAQNGAYLANALRRIVDQTATDDRPLGVLSDIEADLVRVVPEVLGLELDEDESRRQRQLVVRMRDEAPFPARVASDGTLRVIALLVALYDPMGFGLICCEEPENGIYPQRLAQFIAQLRDLVRRKLVEAADDRHAAWTQLLLTSHSPTVIEALRSGDEPSGSVRDDAVFLDTWSHIEPGTPKSRVTRVRKIAATRQLPVDAPVGTVVGPAEIDEFEVRDRLGI